MSHLIHEADMQTIRKRSMYTFIGFLALSALWSIGVIMFGDFGGWFEIRVLLTTILIAAASICCMGCALYAEKTGRREIGFAGAALNLCSAGMIILGMWIEIDSEGFWKTAAIIGTCGVGAAHYFLLGILELKPSHQWLHKAALFTIALNVLLISAAIMGEIDEELYYKFLAAVSIIAGLETLVMPILSRMERKRAQEDSGRDRLILELVEDNLYKTKNGDYFRLEMVAAPDKDTAVQGVGDGC